MINTKETWWKFVRSMYSTINDTQNCVGTRGKLFIVYLMDVKRVHHCFHSPVWSLKSPVLLRRKTHCRTTFSPPSRCGAFCCETLSVMSTVNWPSMAHLCNLVAPIGWHWSWRLFSAWYPDLCAENAHHLGCLLLGMGCCWLTYSAWLRDAP